MLVMLDIGAVYDRLILALSGGHLKNQSRKVYSMRCSTVRSLKAILHESECWLGLCFHHCALYPHAAGYWNWNVLDKKDWNISNRFGKRKERLLLSVGHVS